MVKSRNPQDAVVEQKSEKKNKKVRCRNTVVPIALVWGATRLDRLGVPKKLRTLIAVADSGSFSAAGRNLRRVQSAVSQTMQALESTLGVALFDRSGKVPALTDAGKAILLVSAELREVLTLADRVAVMYGGRIVAELPRAEASEDVLGPYMTGARKRATEAA